MFMLACVKWWLVTGLSRIIISEFLNRPLMILDLLILAFTVICIEEVYVPCANIYAHISICLHQVFTRTVLSLFCLCFYKL
jgi:hypothetical protein